MKIAYVIVGLLVVLAVVAIGAIVFLNMQPSTAAQQTSTPRARNSPVPGQENSTRDPQDDSPEDNLPNAPVTGGNDNAPVQGPLDDSAPNTNNPNIPPVEAPPSNDGMVSLPGTAWVQTDTGELYEFCSDNKWQISDENDTVTGTGTFEQTSTTLVLAGDGDPKTYGLTWDSTVSVLALKDADTTHSLAYEGASDCQ